MISGIQFDPAIFSQGLDDNLHWNDWLSIVWTPDYYLGLLSVSYSSLETYLHCRFTDEFLSLSRLGIYLPWTYLFIFLSTLFPLYWLMEFSFPILEKKIEMHCTVFTHWFFSAVWTSTEYNYILYVLYNGLTDCLFFTNWEYCFLIHLFFSILELLTFLPWININWPIFFS